MPALWLPENFKHVEDRISYTFTNREILREALDFGTYRGPTDPIHNDGNIVLAMIGYDAVDLARLREEWEAKTSFGKWQSVDLVSNC